MSIYNVSLIDVAFMVPCSPLMSCGMRLDKGMLHIMMHLTQPSMVHKKIKGYVAVMLAFCQT
jgi:hypothetical protein